LTARTAQVVQPPRSGADRQCPEEAAAIGDGISRLRRHRLLARGGGRSAAWIEQRSGELELLP
jgi:hypothetical protein